MVLPAILAGIGGIARSPTFLSLAGSILPSVVSALTGSPTEEEAKAKFAPQREAFIQDLMKEGIDRAEAELYGDDAIKGEVEAAMNSGGIPPWLEGALAVAGGLGGWKAGTWLKGRAAAKLGDKAAAAAPAIEKSNAEAAVIDKHANAGDVDESAKTLTSPFVKPIRDPSQALTGGTQTRLRTLAPEEMPTATDVAPVRSPFAWADEAVEAMPKRDPMAWADDAVRPPPAAPYVPSRPIDPLTGAPRAPRGRIDPTTGAPLPTEEVRPVEVAGPFFKRDPLTGGRAYDTGEQRAFAAADRNAQRDAELRRGTMDAVDMVDAELKERQMAAMRAYDEIQRNRGR